MDREMEKEGGVETGERDMKLKGSSECKGCIKWVKARWNIQPKVQQRKTCYTKTCAAHAFVECYTVSSCCF